MDVSLELQGCNTIVPCYNELIGGTIAEENARQLIMK
jgi:hypothetical protein